MNDMQIFNNPEFGDVRTMEENGAVLFCGADVARVLGYKNPQKAIRDNCKYRTTSSVPHPQSPDKTIEMVFITESDLYKLVFRSSLPNAEKFTDWVTSEILPSVRQTGSYSAPQLTPAQLIAAQAQVLVDMEQKMLTIQSQAQAIQDQQTALSNKVDTALKAFSRPAEDHWKSDVDQAIKDLCQEHGYGEPRTRGKMYRELEVKIGCNIDSRLTHLRKRMKKQGMRHKDAKCLTKLDAIAADKQLRAAFEGIVREWQARSIVVEGQQEIQIVQDSFYQTEREKKWSEFRDTM